MEKAELGLHYIEKWVPEISVEYQDGNPALNLGLNMTLFFKDAHTQPVRERLLLCIDKYFDEFGAHLKKTLPGNRWTSITEKNYAKQRQRLLDMQANEGWDCVFSSAKESSHAADYSLSILTKREFLNENDRSIIKLIFPLSYLKEPDGAARYEQWLLWLCDTLPVDSGHAGLVFNVPYAFERTFAQEYVSAQRFPGVMVDSLGFLYGREAANSLKGASWYTIVGTPWIERLGGSETIHTRLAPTPEIEPLPYQHGLILKAGELPPPLGEVNSEPLPPLLVKVNQIILPVRCYGQNGLHFYSGVPGFQFDKQSSIKWYARFDEASRALNEAEGVEERVLRITCWSGEASPYTGVWGAIPHDSTQYIEVTEGQLMPEFVDEKGQSHRTCWSLLKRNDSGSVFGA